MFAVTVDFNSGGQPVTKYVPSFSDLSLYLEWVQSTIEIDAQTHIEIEIKSVPTPQSKLFNLINPEGKVHA